ncbi:MAG: hypothetical protein WA609_13480 [Terriglobales bacterium]
MPDWLKPEARLRRAAASAAGWTLGGDMGGDLERDLEGQLETELEGQLERDRMETGGNMNHGELDRILSKRDDIQPSSGFAASVMEAVREEAAAPAPIPFPWKRALPVLVFAALALVVVVVAGAASIVQLSHGEVTAQIASSSSSLWDWLPASAHGFAGTSVAWTAAALLAAYVSVRLSMRLGAGRV